MQVFIPETLNPYLYDHPDGIAYIVSSICDRYHFDRRYNYGDAVPLQTSILRQVLGKRHTKPTLEEALTYWIIDTNGSYIPGKSSKKYSINPKLCKDKMVPYEITDKGINKRLTKYKLGKAIKARKRYKDVHYKLEEDLNLLEIDELTEENLIYYTKEGTIGQINGNIDTYRKIRNKDWIHTVCDNDRFHTNLTNMARGLRKHVSVGGKRLEWADINCSQLFVLAICIKSYISYLYREGTPSNQLPFNQGLPPYDGKMDLELKTFTKQVESGSFYHICAEEMGLTKADVKENLIQVLFDRDRSKCKFTAYYKKHFPNLFEIIRHMKKDGHADLARYLQQTEASLIFEICTLLKKEHPELPLYTIHDAIGTTEGNLDIVLEAMNRVFKQHEMNPSIDTGDNMYVTGDLVVVDGKEEIGEILYSTGEYWNVSYTDGCQKVHLNELSHYHNEIDRRMRRFYQRTMFSDCYIVDDITVEDFDFDKEYDNMTVNEAEEYIQEMSDDPPEIEDVGGYYGGLIL